MARNEFENVDFLNLPDPDPTIANYYVIDGKTIAREQYKQLDNPPVICAKEIQNKETKITTYFILCNTRNQMFDPNEKDIRYKRRNDWKFRKVVRSTFETYVSFLRNHYKSLLSQAERGL